MPMPKFTVDFKSPHNPERTFDMIKGFLSKEDELKRFDAKAQVSFNDGTKAASIKGSQFQAEMKVSAEGEKSQVVVTVDLPFLLTPFKGKVQEGIMKMLTRHLS